MIKYYIDSPSKELIEKDKDFTISGWALSLSKIKFINIYINDVFHKEINEFHDRLDVVNAFPLYNDCLSCGFSFELYIKFLDWGENNIKLEFIDFDNNIEITYKKIVRTKSNLEYHNYYIASIEKQYRMLEKYLLNNIPVEIYVDCTETNGLLNTLNSLKNQSYLNITYKLFTKSNNISEIKKIIESEYSFDKLFIEELLIIREIGYVTFLKASEILEYNSIKRFIKELEHKEEVSLCYSDSDYYLSNGIHLAPNFKPDYSYNYLLSKNYIGGVYLINKNNYNLGLIDLTYNDWRYKLLLDIISNSEDKNILHISDVLWSESYTEGELCANSPEIVDIIEEHLLNTGLNFDKIVNDNEFNDIKWSYSNKIKVSIIIPTTGNISLVKPLIDSIFEKTIYNNFEIIFLDNGRGKHPDGIKFLKDKGLKVIEVNEVFNWSRLNNIGVQNSDGELLLFLNDDMEVIDELWLEELVRQAVRPTIGAVGGLLLYPDKRIQHAGVFLVDHGGGARHWLHFANQEKEIYQNLHKTVREVSANTGACLMIRREVYSEVGGFDENLPIVGNDIDICLKILQKGYKNIWTPKCSLIHHESISRKKITFTDDEKEMWNRWGDLYMKGDSFYNSNLSLNNSKCELADYQQIELKKEMIDESLNGINLIGYIKAQMGVGEGARGVARALYTGNVPFCIINYEKGNPSSMGDNTWNKLIVDEPKFDINILHINADLTPTVVNDLPENYFKNKYTIGFWAWELPDFPDDWKSSFSYVNEIWVPSVFVKEAVEKKTSLPVYVMPHPIEKVNTPYLNRKYFKLPEDRFLFLMMYDIHSIQERKNPKGSIKAFKKAFNFNDNSVGLVIKVNNSNEDELNQLKQEIGEYNNIYLLDKNMSRHEVDSLIKSCDSFVSLHRSEGFGLVLAEAMALGKPVISTNWSGNIDFMNINNSICIEYELKKLEKDYGPYKSYQHWAEPSIEHASQMMIKLVKEGDLYQNISEKCQKYVIDNLSPLVISKIMIDRINEIKELIN
jgi:GT2 family glycosyltransferase/glycosyltransferase involved in cell wall biosynthesis